MVAAPEVKTFRGTVSEMVKPDAMAPDSIPAKSIKAGRCRLDQ